MRDIFLCQVGVCASESEGTGSGALSTGKNTAPELGREGLRLLSLAVGSCCECRGVVLNQPLLLGWVWDGLGCSAGAWAGPGLCRCGLKPILQGPPFADLVPGSPAYYLLSIVITRVNCRDNNAVWRSCICLP